MRIRIAVVGTDGRIVPIEKTVGPADRPGTVESEEGNDRHTYLFGFILGVPAVWEAIGGVQLADEQHREIIDTTIVPLSDLAEPYELRVVRRGKPITVRFTLVP